MDPEQLEAIHARAQATTPGKWHWAAGENELGEGYCWLNDRGHDLFMCGDPNKKENTIFVGHARQDVLDLVSEVKWLNDMIQRARGGW